MPPEMTTAEFYAAVLQRLQRLDELSVVGTYALCCIAAANTFIVIMYAARNKNFWGCFAFAAGLFFSSSAFADASWYSNWTTNAPYCTDAGPYQTWVNGGTVHVNKGGVQCDANWSYVVRISNGVVSEATVYGCTQEFTGAGDGAVLASHSIAYSGSCVVCDQYNENLVGFSCCPPGQFGATYYVATDADGCDYVTCNTSACHGCPTPPSVSEGSTCSCGEGQGDGVVAYTYDSDGCPVGTICDSCVPCPELAGSAGDSCEASDGSPGHLVSGTTADGCPTLACATDDIPVCELDSNRNGTPDYLDGNPLAAVEEGTACACSNGDQGVVEMRNNSDGCPVPTCSCESDCAAGDVDNDGCCDDEDPDKEDPNSNCDSCDYKFSQKVGEIVGLFRAKIGVPQGGTSSKDWEFDVDLGSTGSTAAFGIRFGGNLTTGTFWLGQPGGPVRPEQGTVFSEFLSWRSTVRIVLALCCYLIFSGNVLSAVFNTAR